MAVPESKSVARRLALLPLLVCAFACGEASRESTTIRPALAVGAAVSRPTPSATVDVEAHELAVPETHRPAAPSFEGATGWLNVTRPLNAEDLRGHVVLVDFWTSCCINCLHTLPALKELEARFPASSFLVVGVHSPKFETERGTDRLEAIARQYRIQHPIAVDGNMAIWDRWGASSWPTLALIDSSGRIAWVGHGEPDVDELANVIAAEIARARDVERNLATTPVAVVHASTWDAPAVAFPSGVAVVDARTLAVSDTGNGRVLLVARDGHVVRALGEGELLLPHGLSVHQGFVYVADTDHHQVKRIRISTGDVEVVAGTGEIGFAPLRDQWRRGSEVALRSPWATAWVGNRLFLALAGSHQIAEVDVTDGRVRGFAGDGREALRDGERMDASFAQPSALATDGTELFVLDSESSSVRAIHLRTSHVRTLVGRGLFEFGLVDGTPDVARLQHPLGLAFAAGALWIADTYNNAMRRVEIASGATSTRLASTNHDALYEPAAVAADGDTLWIADTNHHRIVSLRASNGPSRVVAFRDAPTPSHVVASVPVDRLASREFETVEFEPLPTVPGQSTTLRVQFSLPEGTVVNEEAPFSLVLRRASEARIAGLPVERLGRDVQTGFTLQVELASRSSQGDASLDLQMVVCDDVRHAACVPVERTIHIPLRAAGNAPGDATRAISLPSAVVAP